MKEHTAPTQKKTQWFMKTRLDCLMLFALFSSIASLCVGDVFV